MEQATPHRPIYVIAREIRATWKKVHFAAEPCLGAMSQLSAVGDKYGMDDAKAIIYYFLSNAGTWRGDNAKRIKAELKGML
jgi:hypothetical protein